MLNKQRKRYCVIAACCSDIEQREILKGIISSANQNDTDVVILSNIYNPNEPNDTLSVENTIYDLVCSTSYDGFILISEAIINPILQERIKNNLQKISEAPVVVIGTPLPNFFLPNFHFINSDDEKDIEAITEHLITVHHFTNIDILSGYDFIEASHLRVKGYKNVLERHGIPYREDHVIYGNFWMNSGEDLANEYLQGIRPYPEALICCNDYMAYGLLDKFMDAGVNIQEKMAVVGYEYIRERRNHIPLLTTFQRNRYGIGEKAVSMLDSYLENGTYPNYTYPVGRLIPGETCGCKVCYSDLKMEIHDIQQKETYSQLNLMSQMEHRLTECRNLEEFVNRCWDFQFMIRDVFKQYLCLYENWFQDIPNSEQLTCYSLLGYEPPITIKKTDLSPLMRKKASCYYCSPLFFEKKELGFVVLSFDKADTYDTIYRNWLKSLANGLEILRMKNDIRYLTACQNLSKVKDSLTGLYTQEGIEQYFSQLSAKEKENMYFLSLKICNDINNTNRNVADEKVAAILSAAESLSTFSSHGVYAHISTYHFVGFINLSGKVDESQLYHKLYAILAQQKRYIRVFHIDSITAKLFPIDDTMNFNSLMEQCTPQQSDEAKENINAYYPELRKIKEDLFLTPELEHTLKEYATILHISESHLRLLYRQCFHSKFQGDKIVGRIYKAIFLFCTTTLTATEVAEWCGYSDEKYFLRQFTEITGFTTKQYKKTIVGM